MKKRAGFVSNSSSSSFVFFGFEIDYRKIDIDFLNKYANITQEDIENYGYYECCGRTLNDDVNFCPKCGKPKTEMALSVDMTEVFDDLVSDANLPNGLELFTPDGGDSYYLGYNFGSSFSYKDILDREAFKEFVPVFEGEVGDVDQWLIDNLEIISGELYD